MKVVEACGILLANLLLMLVKKALNSFAILSSSKISTSLAVIFHGKFDDLSCIFPISSITMLLVFWHHVFI